MLNRFTYMTDRHASLTPDLATLRVHAAAIGYDELHRVLEPLRLLRADAFFLLQYPKNDRSEKRYAKSGVKVLDEARKLGLVHCEVWPVDVWDAAAVGHALGQKVQELGLQSLEVNVSTGPKTVGIGATLASHFWPVKLYYADADYEKPTLEPNYLGYQLRHIQRIPTFQAKPVREDGLDTLQLLVDKGKPLAFPVLKNLLRERQVIRADKRKRARPGDLSPQAIHSQYQTIVNPLKEQGLVKEVLVAGRRCVAYTEEGRATLRLLRGK